MTEKTEKQKVQERQDGNYKAPIITEPRAKAPIPQWVPITTR
jgi:hypothetical protein